MDRRESWVTDDPVPFVDLKAAHAEIRGEVERGWASVVARAAFLQSEDVCRFEEAYAATVGVRHCVSVASGTDALELALRALGIGPCDDVLVPAFTFAATAMAVLRTGARPVFVDVDETTLLIDPAAAGAALTSRTTAIVPVHLYGQVADMAGLGALARRHGLALVEDAAQAHGATQAGAPAGSLGDVAATSFYPSKNLGAYGDAGAVLTDDAAVAAGLTALRNYGGEAKHQHDVVGFNSRLDALQAVVLAAKLPRLPAWNERRRRAAECYRDLLEDTPGIRLPQTLEGNSPAWHLYVVRTARRDHVLTALRAAGITAGVHYPDALHLLPAFTEPGRGPGAFPRAEQAASEVLSLPMFPHITPDQQQRVAEAVRAAVL
jgi:dTDP-4-amino-4,6-dideoxygalactose transaminase